MDLERDIAAALSHLSTLLNEFKRIGDVANISRISRAMSLTDSTWCNVLQREREAAGTTKQQAVADLITDYRQ